MNTVISLLVLCAALYGLYLVIRNNRATDRKDDGGGGGGSGKKNLTEKK